MKKFTLLLIGALGISSIMAQNPTYEWVKNVAFSENDEIINCMDEDNNSNLFFAGKSLNGTTYFNNGDSVLGDFTYHGFLAKADSNGLVIWSKEFDHLSQHGVSSIKVGANNTFFVAGRTEQSPVLDGVSIPNPSIYIFKYDFNGNLLAHIEYECSNSVFGLQDMEVDQNNNVYIAGHFNGILKQGANTIASGGGIYHFKFDANLNQQWYQNFSGFTYDLEIANDGNLLAVGDCPSSAAFGSFNGGSTGYTNPFLVKLDAATGNPMFLHTPTSYNGGEAKTVTQNDNGDIYIGGWFGKSSNHGSLVQSTMDFGSFTIDPRPLVGSPIFVVKSGFMAKYNSSGTPQWAKVIGDLFSGHVNTLTHHNNVITVFGECLNKALFENPNDSIWIFSFNENYNDGGSLNNYFAQIDANGNWLNVRPNSFSTQIEEFLQTSTGSIYLTGSFNNSYSYNLLDSVTHVGNSLYGDGFIAKLGDISTINLNEPSDLQVDNYSSSGIYGGFDVSWTDNSTDEHGFALSHGYAPTTIGLGEQKIGANTTNSTIESLYLGTPYSMVVQTFKFDVLSAPSSTLTDTPQTVSSISENNLNLENVKVFPNPNQGIFTISCLKNIKSIEVYNLQGKNMLSQTVNDQQVNVNMHELPKGIYLIKMIFKDDMVIKKVILE